MDSVKQFHVGVILKYPPISPLSLRERARVRGLFQSTNKSGINAASLSRSNR
jgi:hypothetical protein